MFVAKNFTGLEGVFTPVEETSTRSSSSSTATSTTYPSRLPQRRRRRLGPGKAAEL